MQNKIQTLLSTLLPALSAMSFSLSSLIGEEGAGRLCLRVAAGSLRDMGIFDKQKMESWESAMECSQQDEWKGI